MRSTSVRRIATAGAAAAAVLGTFSATAVANDEGNNPIEAGTDAYLAAYPNMSREQARAAASQSDARRALYDAAASDSKSFAGAWFDPTAGVVHVAGTTDGALENAAELGRRLGLNVTGVRVARSAAQLEQRAAELRAGRGALGQAAEGRVGVDVTTNKVVAAVPRSRRAALAKSAAASGDTAVAVVDDPGLPIEADAGCTSRSACDWTIRAGAIMWRGLTTANTPWCSVGFTARNASNQRFVYTAGHCTTGNGVNWGTGAKDIGPMTSSMDSGAVDASIIKVTNSWFTGDSGGEIYFEDGGARTAPVKGVASSVGYMVAGETVCLSANFTSPSSTNPCGVLGTNSDAGVRGMARVDGVDACGGDSGGGWYWLSSSGNRYAYGIHSRSDTGCHGDAGGTHSWYTAIATAKSSFQPTLNVEIRP
jgi:streptogrisin C